MEAYKKLLESRAKIRFQDCDPFNHLNNSRYIDYFVDARGDQLIEHYGFDIYKYAREYGLGWVSAQTQISYLSPAQLMEEVVIQTRLIACSEKSLLMEAQMWDLHKNNIKAVMWTKLVHFNLSTQRSHQHAEELMLFFRQFVYPLDTAMNFEERVMHLRRLPLEK